MRLLGSRGVGADEHGWLQSIVPRMRSRGMSEAEIDDVIVHNPQAVLTFEEPEAAQVGPNPTAGSSLARM